MCKCPLDSDIEKNENPHSEWCDECQESSCKTCFIEDHEKCESSGNKVTQLINKCMIDPSEHKEEIYKIKNKVLKKTLTDLFNHRKEGISHPL